MSLQNETFYFKLLTILYLKKGQTITLNEENHYYSGKNTKKKKLTFRFHIKLEPYTIP